MIDYENIVSAIQRRYGVDRNTAWEGLNTAFLQLDRTRSEAEQAAYLINVGCLKIWKDKFDSVESRSITETEFNFDNSLNPMDDDDHAMRELFIAPPEPEQCDNDFIIDIVRHVPQQYKFGVAIVVAALLKEDRKRKPLTVEMTRQYLKRAKVPNTTEQAQQVYTFLTTLRRHK
jgi:hypothetical protein